MQIKIQSIHFTADEKLLDYVEKKVEKVKKFFDGIVRADVYLKLDSKGKSVNDKVVEIRLLIPGNDLFAKETRKSFEECVDEVVDILEQQLKKRKAKLKDERVRKSQIELK